MYTLYRGFKGLSYKMGTRKSSRGLSTSLGGRWPGNSSPQSNKLDVSEGPVQCLKGPWRDAGIELTVKNQEQDSDISDDDNTYVYPLKDKKRLMYKYALLSFAIISSRPHVCGEMTSVFTADLAPQGSVSHVSSLWGAPIDIHRHVRLTEFQTSQFSQAGRQDQTYSTLTSSDSVMAFAFQ